MSAILEVKDLKKYFKVGSGMLHAVDGVSFEINEGETLGVVGESGCGKSTLGRVILHLLDNTGGQILYRGEDITNVSQEKLSALRREMQIIFQDPFASLNPRMTVYQTIAEPMEIAKGYTKSQIQERVSEMMDTVGLAPRFVNSYPHELDGGRRQRIGIARALVLSPKFIVCDEPVSALDVSIQAQVLNLMLDIQEKFGLTYIFITHDLSVVKYISNDIMVMYLGQMVEKAPSDELFAHRYHPYTQALISAVPVPDIDHKRERIHLKGELTSPIDPQPGCRFASRCMYATPECSAREPELEEISPDHFIRCLRARELNGL
ncbi:oligopeptide/dipeptide ABC transporter ATP-binding protein [Clostridium phoceensis]|uniref:ABC transporter ATP-binding protein n=1 Tax=Clostridium phoceensis TaxID=1650661 RepID=UPI002E795251|nr:oligopeptide/dipeptide ABC transporter ATP-binding protein [Clostridium phoceensis]